MITPGPSRNSRWTNVIDEISLIDDIEDLSDKTSSSGGSEMVESSRVRVVCTRSAGSGDWNCCSSDARFPTHDRDRDSNGGNISRKSGNGVSSGSVTVMCGRLDECVGEAALIVDTEDVRDMAASGSGGEMTKSRRVGFVGVYSSISEDWVFCSSNIWLPACD